MKYNSYWWWRLDAIEAAWLEEKTLRVLSEFYTRFRGVLPLIMGAQATTCASTVIREDRTTERSRVKFVNRFVSQMLQQESLQPLVQKLRRRCARIHVDVEAAIVVMALYHHAQMFGVPRLAPPEKKGWQNVTGKDGAKYQVLHDTGAYLEHLESVGSES